MMITCDQDDKDEYESPEKSVVSSFPPRQSPSGHSRIDRY